MIDFNIIDVTVTHTYHYDPSEYLECCEQNGIAPTEAGFIDFIEDEVQADFPISTYHSYVVNYRNND